MKRQDAEKIVLEELMGHINDPVVYTKLIGGVKPNHMKKIDLAIDKYLDILAKRLVTIKAYLGELDAD